MSSYVVTSSFDEKIRTRSATKAILDFESCLFLRLPKLGRKAMIGMLAGSEVIDFEKACGKKRAEVQVIHSSKEVPRAQISPVQFRHCS